MRQNRKALNCGRLAPCGRPSPEPDATQEQRKAAVDVYRAAVHQAREVRHDAVKAAIATYHADRKAAREAFRAAIGR